MLVRYFYTTAYATTAAWLEGVINVRKIYLTVAVIIFTCVFSSCTPGGWAELPEGVWKSENPDMTFYIGDEYNIQVWTNGYPGIYTIDEEEKKFFMHISLREWQFSTHDVTDLKHGEAIGSNTIIFSGSFITSDNQMIYTPTSFYQNKWGYEQIIFTKLDDYPPINPQDWIPVEEEQD
jgi:hypothetical protein